MEYDKRTEKLVTNEFDWSRLDGMTPEEMCNYILTLSEGLDQAKIKCFYDYEDSNIGIEGITEKTPSEIEAFDKRSAQSKKTAKKKRKKRIKELEKLIAQEQGQ